MKFKAFLLLVFISVCGVAAYAQFGQGGFGDITPPKVTGSTVNWTDIRVFASKLGGNTSGINWQAFGV